MDRNKAGLREALNQAIVALEDGIFSLSDLSELVNLTENISFKSRTSFNLWIDGEIFRLSKKINELRKMF